jgi:hypothetical protein
MCFSSLPQHLKSFKLTAVQRSKKYTHKENGHVQPYFFVSGAALLFIGIYGERERAVFATISSTEKLELYLSPFTAHGTFGGLQGCTKRNANALCLKDIRLVDSLRVQEHNRSPGFTRRAEPLSSKDALREEDAERSIQIRIEQRIVEVFYDI